MVAVPRQRVRTRSEKHRLPRAKARVVGPAAFVVATVLPFALWHRPMALIASDFRLELDYLLTGWTAYALIGAGLAFLAPVVVSIGRGPGSRLYPRARAAYVAWGLVLYLLGFLLATQVAQIARVSAAG